MTITESELREILDRESDDGPHGGVTVADVDRRFRRIKRRRAGLLSGAAVAGLAVAAAFTLPAGDAADVPGDLWTGVMTQPTSRHSTVSTPVAGTVTREELVVKGFEGGGVRKEFTVATKAAPISVTVWCTGPLNRAALWIDGRLVEAGPCGEKGDRRYTVTWEGPRDGRAARHTVAGAVLRADDPSGTTVTGTAGVERLLAEGRRFDVSWKVLVHRVGIPPECRNRVAEVDPRTGRVVRLRCAGKDTTP
ncbi:hypothetical protein AB0J63_24445 [Streptosporangium canum]|uniref:hypothetical protein n=1 Tax=Streptosporangium canum TaxID=324952 RepID=UPI00342608BA